MKAIKRKFGFWTASCVFILILGTVVFFSCNKEEAKVNLLEVPNYEIYQTIGVEHNNGLNYVFKQLKAEKERVGKDGFITKRANIRALVEQATKDFTAEMFEVNDEDLLHVNEQISAIFQQPLRLKSGSNEELHLYDADMKEELSSLQIKFLDDLNLVMSDDDGDLESLQARILEIEKEAVMKMEEEDYIVILVATSVAKNTLAYWHANLDEWVELLSEDVDSFQQKNDVKEVQGAKEVQTEEDNRVDFSWKLVGKEDVAGAFGAAFGSGVSYVLTAGPVGWKVWAAIVVGGAAGTSAQNAIGQLW